MPLWQITGWLPHTSPCTLYTLYLLVVHVLYVLHSAGCVHTICSLRARRMHWKTNYATTFCVGKNSSDRWSTWSTIQYFTLFICSVLLCRSWRRYHWPMSTRIWSCCWLSSGSCAPQLTRQRHDWRVRQPTHTCLCTGMVWMACLLRVTLPSLSRGGVHCRRPCQEDQRAERCTGQMEGTYNTAWTSPHGHSMFCAMIVFLMI